jgi:hypothetical protein
VNVGWFEKSHAGLEPLSRKMIVSDEASLEEWTRINLFKSLFHPQVALSLEIRFVFDQFIYRRPSKTRFSRPSTFPYIINSRHAKWGILICVGQMTPSKTRLK